MEVACNSDDEGLKPIKINYGHAPSPPPSQFPTHTKSKNNSTLGDSLLITYMNGGKSDIAEQAGKVPLAMEDGSENGSEDGSDNESEDESTKGDLEPTNLAQTATDTGAPAQELEELPDTVKASKFELLSILTKSESAASNQEITSAHLLSRQKTNKEIGRTETDNQLNQQLFICQEAGYTATPFQTQYLLASHAVVYSSARPHYGSVKGCPRSKGGKGFKGFKRKNEIIRHALVHDSPGYVCPFCTDKERKYPRPDNLQRHVRIRHADKNINDF